MHDGENGFCTHVGNDFFAFFESTDSKSRINFLEILRGRSTAYTLNDCAVEYWNRQKLAQTVIKELLCGEKEFADEQAWSAWLTRNQVIDQRHVRIATEGALLGTLIAQGVSPELVVLSDGAGQFNILVHALCWIHVERPLAGLVPSNEEHKKKIEEVRKQIWELYQKLKEYKESPGEQQKEELEKQFDALVEQETPYPSINSVLGGMKLKRAELLRVLERPETPLHNNLSESHIREYVKKRKISGSTRSEAGRKTRDTFASLKKTCMRLAVRFWEYLRDRVRGSGKIASLAKLIAEKAQEQADNKDRAATLVGATSGAAG
jgi:hypothetical protein